MEQLKKDLEVLLFLFARGRKTYDGYLANGKTYLYAQILKDNNSKIRELVMSIAYKLPEDLYQECISLVHHIDVWSVLWDELKIELSPKLSDEFVFENSVNYPPTVENKLQSYFTSIK